MISLPKFIVDYVQLKQAMLRHLGVYNALAIVLLWAFHPAWVLPYFLGALTGFGYLLSLFLSTEYPQKGFSIFLSIVRVGLVGFLVAYFGHFNIFETGVVFCGFLSYKIVLVLEIVRFSVGLKLNSDN